MAEEVVEAAAPPGWASLSAGDAAWWAGDRGAAVAAWREALAAASDPAVRDTPQAAAVEMMVRIRLLSFSGNLGPFVHEDKLWDRLDACPRTEPWCLLARADSELFMPAFTGADPQRVTDWLAPSVLAASRAPPAVLGAAAARRALATEALSALDDAPPGTLDGMGQGMTQTHRLRPPYLGTWNLGLGVAAVPGNGVMLNAAFTHPDWRYTGQRLSLSVGGDTTGGWSLQGGWLHPAGWDLAGGGSLGWVYRYDAGTYTSAARLQTLHASGGHTWQAVGRSVGQPRSLRLGVSSRADHRAESEGTPEGPWLVVGGGSVDVRAGGEAAAREAGVALEGGSYWRPSGRVDAHLQQPLGPLTFAGRAGVEAVVPLDLGEPLPFYRLPAGGGMNLLRGLPYGVVREEVLPSAQGEVWVPLKPPLTLVGFADGAWAAEQPWWTVGGGVRMDVAPGQSTRIEYGWGPQGSGLVIGVQRPW